MPLPELLGSALEGQAHTKIHIRKETLCASIAQEEKEKEEKKKEITCTDTRGSSSGRVF